MTRVQNLRLISITVFGSIAVTLLIYALVEPPDYRLWIQIVLLFLYVLSTAAALRREIKSGGRTGSEGARRAQRRVVTVILTLVFVAMVVALILPLGFGVTLRTTNYVLLLGSIPVALLSYAATFWRERRSLRR